MQAPAAHIFAMGNSAAAPLRHLRRKAHGGLQGLTGVSGHIQPPIAHALRNHGLGMAQQPQAGGPLHATHCASTMPAVRYRASSQTCCVAPKQSPVMPPSRR